METQSGQDIPRVVVAVAVFALALMVGGVYAGYRLQRAYLTHQAQALASNWPQTPQLLARLMLDRYGPPDRVGSGTLVWYKRAPWKRIAVHEDQHRGPLEEVVSYDVDTPPADALAAFGRGVYVDAADSELSAQSDNEGLNFLALNLADEIISDKRPADEARKIYDQTAALAASGKSSGYMQGLLFEPRSSTPNMLVKDLAY